MQEIDEKMESMQLEWTYNLTTQLEKQKEYFEDKISILQQSFTAESTELRQKLLKSTEENRKLQVKTFIKILKTSLFNKWSKHIFNII